MAVNRTDGGRGTGEAVHRWPWYALALVAVVTTCVVLLAVYGAITLIGQLRGDSGGDAEVGTSIGDIAPDVTVFDLSGSAVQLRDLRGRTVLLNFRATWCHYCQLEAPALQQAYEDIDDLAILAVYVAEDAATVTRFAEANGYTFGMYTDAGDAATAYGVQGIPASYFIDAKGRIFATALGQLTSESLQYYLAEQ